MYNAMNNLTYNETKVNLEYKALHGFYWMLYCLTTGYTTVLLLSHGFSSSSSASRPAAAAAQTQDKNIAKPRAFKLLLSRNARGIMLS